MFYNITLLHQLIIPKCPKHLVIPLKLLLLVGHLAFVLILQQRNVA